MIDLYISCLNLSASVTGLLCIIGWLCPLIDLRRFDNGQGYIYRGLSSDGPVVLISKILPFVDISQLRFVLVNESWLLFTKTLKTQSCYVSTFSFINFCVLTDGVAHLADKDASRRWSCASRRAFVRSRVRSVINWRSQQPPQMIVGSGPFKKFPTTT